MVTTRIKPEGGKAKRIPPFVFYLRIIVHQGIFPRKGPYSNQILKKEKIMLVKEEEKSIIREKYLQFIVDASQEGNWYPEIIAAIMSRESR